MCRFLRSFQGPFIEPKFQTILNYISLVVYIIGILTYIFGYGTCLTFALLPDIDMNVYIVWELLVYIAMLGLLGMLTYLIAKFGYERIIINETKLSKRFFVAILVIFSIFWSFYVCNYYKNVERTSELIYEDTGELEITYFYDLPLQQTFEMMPENVILEGEAMVKEYSQNDKLPDWYLNADGWYEVVTSEVIPYWYINSDGEGQYNTVLAEDCRIVFASEPCTPKLKMITRIQLEKQINHNTGEVKVLNEHYLRTHYFYLPESYKAQLLG